MIPCPEPDQIQLRQDLEDGDILLMYRNGTIIHWHKRNDTLYTPEVVAIEGKAI